RLEPGDGLVGVALGRGPGLHEDEIVGALHGPALGGLGVGLLLLGAVALAAGTVAGLDDPRDADRAARDEHDERAGEHGERRAIAAGEARGSLPRRVRVRADDLAGLEAAEVLGELAG